MRAFSTQKAALDVATTLALEEMSGWAPGTDVVNQFQELVVRGDLQGALSLYATWLDSGVDAPLIEVRACVVEEGFGVEVEVPPSREEVQGGDLTL